MDAPSPRAARVAGGPGCAPECVKAGREPAEEEPSQADWCGAAVSEMGRGLKAAGMKQAALRVERGSLPLTPSEWHDGRRAAADDACCVGLETDREDVALGHA